MEKEKIKEAMQSMLSVYKEDHLLKSFANEKFHEKFPVSSPALVWFTGYDIVNENTIRVNYGYGVGDVNMEKYFDVKIEE